MTPCPTCGGQEGEHTPSCARTRNRQHAAAGANCLGAVVDLQAFDDAQQRASRAAVTIPYEGSTGQVTRGLYQGMHIRHAVIMETTYLSRTWAHITVHDVIVRPWWRWWQPTPARRITPTISPEESPIALR